MAKTAYKASGLKLYRQGVANKIVYAQWTAFSSGKQKNMSGIKCTFKYRVKNNKGATVYFTGSSSTLGKGASRSGTYSAPEESDMVQVVITPVLTKKGKKKATAKSVSDTLSFSGLAPGKPSAPTVSVEGYSLTLTVQTSDQYAKTAVFYLFRDSEAKSFWASSKIDISGAGYAQTIVTLEPGHSYYAKVKLFNGSSGSEYSDSSEVSSTTIPEQVTNVVIEPLSQTQLQLSWDAVAGAASTNGYEIEYATDTKYFNSANAQTTSSNNTTMYLTLDAGNVWYFRVRATNSNGISGAWSDPPVSASTAIKPNPPTTWTLQSTATIDDTINLYWTHNTADGAKPTASQIEWAINDGDATIIDITHDLGPDDRDFTFNYAFTFDSSEFSDGDIFKWRVRSQGIASVGWSDYSVLREVRVYSPASLSLGIDSTITAFPIDIDVTVTPSTQEIVSFYLVIKARDSYDDADYMGEFQHVNAGEIIFSRNYTALNNTDTISLFPSDINLLNNQTYDVEAVVATSAGLTANDTTEFTLETEEPDYYLDMGITVDYNSLSAALVPGCYSDINEDPEGDYIYDLADIVEGIILDVYRINFDGTFTPIQTGIDNDGVTVISDPHPALDNGKYRLVATDPVSGVMFFDDIISEDLEVSGLVLQWDANYANYLVRDIVDEIDELAIGDMAGGTTLKLPYNVKKNETSDMDTSLIEYIGRSHPVSYYGTQKGQKSSYSTEVPKDDLESLDLLRKLQIWPGDVYIRAQDGLGYWANAVISFDRDYDAVSMPVNVEVTRVYSDRP